MDQTHNHDDNKPTTETANKKTTMAGPPIGTGPHNWNEGLRDWYEDYVIGMKFT